MMLADIYKMLASPERRFDQTIAETIVASHVTKVLRQTVSQVSEQHSWFGALVDDWQKKDKKLNSLWNPAFAQLESALKSRIKPNNQQLASAALALHECGAEGEWQLQTSTPQSYRYCNRRISACSRISSLKAEGGHYLVCDDRQYSLDSLKPLDHIELQNDVVFDSNPGLDSEKISYDVSAAGWDRKLWSEAVALLNEAAPEYSDWAQRLLCVVVPLDAPENHQISASHWHRRGEVLMSWRIRPDQLAETLVHEASHQHFFMAGMLSRYDDGSDGALYYSPVVKTQRPLVKILLAYHAFANVVLFFHYCRIHLDKKEKKWMDRETSKIMDELKQLEDPLRNSNALTEMGQCLWKPLAAQIDEVIH